MRQRIPGREKMPGIGYEPGLVPKGNKARGFGEGHGHRETPYANLSREHWTVKSPSLRHNWIDNDWAPLGLALG